MGSLSPFRYSSHWPHASTRASLRRDCHGYKPHAGGTILRFGRWRMWSILFFIIPALSWVLGSAPILSNFLTRATLPLIAEQCRGVSPLWFLLLTFLSCLSSWGVLSPLALLEGVVFRGPRGVLGGETRLGLQSTIKNFTLRLRFMLLGDWKDYLLNRDLIDDSNCNIRTKMWLKLRSSNLKSGHVSCWDKMVKFLWIFLYICHNRALCNMKCLMTRAFQ